MMEFIWNQKLYFTILLQTALLSDDSLLLKCPLLENNWSAWSQNERRYQKKVYIKTLPGCIVSFVSIFFFVLEQVKLLLSVD